jgi:hypothetical protein
MDESRIQGALHKYRRQMRRVDRLLALLELQANDAYYYRLEELLEAAENRLAGMRDMLGCLGIINVDVEDC